MCDPNPRSSYRPGSLQKVKEALSWAYRQGYFKAEEAAQELASHLEQDLVKEDLGMYGDTLKFKERTPVK